MRSCPTPTPVVGAPPAPPPPVIALASADIISGFVVPAAPAFRVLTSPSFILDADSVGFSHVNGVLTFLGKTPRLVDVRGHISPTAVEPTDFRLGIALNGSYISQGEGFVFLPAGDPRFVAADALVLLKPGDTLSLAVIVPAPQTMDFLAASIVARAV